MNITLKTPHSRKAAKIALALALIAASQIAGAEAALAQSSAFTPLQLIVDFINGPFGRLLAVIAVMALGFMAFAGRLSWVFAGGVALGIGLVFGAPTIVDQLISSVGN